MADVTMFDVITDSVTGEVTTRELTPEEVTARTPDPAVALAVWRATAKCSRMQGILALGQDRWKQVLAYRETATWAEQIVIDDANDWRRASENIAFFGYLLGLADEEVDALFLAATEIAP